MKFSSEVVERYVDVVEIDGQKFEVEEVVNALDWLGNRLDDCKTSKELATYFLSKQIMLKHAWGGFLRGPNFKTFDTQFHQELRTFEGETK